MRNKGITIIFKASFVLFSAPSIVNFKIPAAVVAVFDDIVLDGEGALVVGDERIGAEPTHTVW